MKSSQLLSSLEDNIQSIITDVENDFLDLDEALLNYKLNQTSWSILECFEHLNRYNRFYNEKFEQAIAKSSQNNNEDEAKSNWLGRKFIAMMHPDNKKKIKTVKSMNPMLGLQSRLGRSTVQEFLRHQRALLRILDSAKRADLDQATIPVEFFKLIRMRLGDALQFVVVHEQRHLIQARNVLSNASKIHDPTLKV
jgi:uncharacterized damage-inducible protein DinB